MFAGSDRTTTAALIATVRELWEHLAGTAARFAPAISVTASPRSYLSPPGWVGIVVIGDAALATAPDHETARLVEEALGDLAGASLADTGALARRLPLDESPGPAALAYLDPADFRPWPGDAAATPLDLDHPGLSGRSGIPRTRLPGELPRRRRGHASRTALKFSCRRREVARLLDSVAAERLARRLLAALYGPTSSGKTAMSVEVASRLQREHGREVAIISADSRQVYRHMDIGTSKTTPGEMRGIRHEMLDVADPVRKFELEEYARLVRGHISDALATEVVPFVVGGTGVYLKALLDGWELDRVGAARSSLRRDFPPSMADDAHAMLRRLDRRAAARVHPHNYAGVINALAARIASEDRAKRRVGLATVTLGLDPGPQALAKRVARTYADQIRRGLFGEILDLNDRYQLDTEMHRRGRDSLNQVLHTHGYREYFQLAAERGKSVADLTGTEHAEVGEQVMRHVRDYTGRQRAWLGKLPAVHMVDTPSQAYRLLARALSSDA